MLENGDSWRDTFVATLRGDGVKLPSFFITQTSHTATYASGRRIPKHVTPIKGMNNDKMKEWIDMISEHVDQPSLLILDQASSHKSPTVIEHIGTKVLPDGTPKFQPLLLPAKASFLISPCDNSFFSAFKTHFAIESTLHGIQETGLWTRIPVNHKDLSRESFASLWCSTV